MTFTLSWLSYFTDLQGSQTPIPGWCGFWELSYFTDLQGSQTLQLIFFVISCLVTLLIYKVLKHVVSPNNEGVKLSYFTDLQGSQTSNFGYHRTQHTGICVNQYSIIHCDWSITCILSHNFLVISCDSIIINCTFW